MANIRRDFLIGSAAGGCCWAWARAAARQLGVGGQDKFDLVIRAKCSIDRTCVHGATSAFAMR